MQWMTVATPPLESVEQFDALIQGQTAEPDGLHARYVGTTENGELRVVAVWESKAHADHFFTQTLGPPSPTPSAPSRSATRGGRHRGRPCVHRPASRLTRPRWVVRVVILATGGSRQRKPPTGCGVGDGRASSRPR
jgi:hypothetical protein